MEAPKIFESEYRFCLILWEHEPVSYTHLDVYKRQPMGFYNIPIVIAFLVAILVACLQNRAVSFEEKLVIMGQGVGDKNIITMLLIFLTAGAFVGVVGRSSCLLYTS